MHFLEEGFAIDRIVIMVQKEVAERFTAPAGKKDYGAITVALNYYGKTELSFIVPRQMFIPQPDVDSAVVNIVPWEEKPLVANDEAWFRKVVKAGFGQRRKTLNNALKVLGLDNEVLQKGVDACSIDGKRRGETLTLEEYIALANALK